MVKRRVESMARATHREGIGALSALNSGRDYQLKSSIDAVLQTQCSFHGDASYKASHHTRMSQLVGAEIEVPTEEVCL
jgi:hypothetical protein